MKPDIGSQLGNYQLVSLLGEGGFARVYLSEHVYLGTLAAIKVLLVGAELTDEDKARFLAEARTIAQLRHFNIVSVLEFGVQDEIPYLVMEYAPQGSLRAKHTRGEMVPLESALSYVQQVATALQYAHNHHVIHCDVKPANMLVGEDGRILLNDFGISRVVQNTVHTQTDAMSGTIAYMAPEQFMGKPVPASDQYSLAVVVYQWLCGHLPFEGTNVAEIFYLHTYAPPASLQDAVPGLPADVEQVVFKALAKKPEQRFPDVQSFASALTDAATPTARRTIWSASPSFPSPGFINSESASWAAPAGDATVYRGGVIDSGSNGWEDEEVLLPPASSMLLPFIRDALGDAAASLVVQQNGDAAPPSLQAGIAGSQAPADAPAQQDDGAVSDSGSIPLLPSFSTLLPPLEAPIADMFQTPTAPAPAEAVAGSAAYEPLLLPSISFMLPSQTAPEEDVATVLMAPPSLPQPGETILIAPDGTASTIRAEEVKRKNYFISYDISDGDWARWIARHMEKAGYSIVPYQETAQAGVNVSAEMQEALTKAEYVIALISPAYVQARSQSSDWTAILRRNMNEEQGKVLPVCVRSCGQSFEQVLNTPVYINLIGLDAPSTLNRLLDGVQQWMEPFPGEPTVVEMLANDMATVRLPEAPLPLQQIEIFISYAHRDKRYRDELDIFLAPLRENYPATTWFDGEIHPGVDFEVEIKKHLSQAHIILLLVSPHFVASRYCRDKELTLAMERHLAGEARVIPIILRPAMWKEDKIPFGKLQALPRDGRPVTQWSSKDAGYLNIAEGIKRVIVEMLQKAKASH